MRDYIVRRVLIAVIVFFIISLMIFWLVNFQANKTVYLPEGLDMEAVERYAEEYNWNDPLIFNYARWMGNVFSGDLGESLYKDSSYSK